MYPFNIARQRRTTDSLKWKRFANQKDLPQDVLPMWVADMDFDCAPEIQSAIIQRAQHPIYGYTVAGESVMAETIGYLRDQTGWVVEPDWIVWLPGVVPGLAASIQAFATPGEAVMTNSPVYHHFLHIAQDAERQLIDVPLVYDPALRYSFDLDAMRRAATPNCKALLLCSPHNPVGRVLTTQELQQLAEFAIEQDMVLVVDEIHSGLVLGNQPFVTMAQAAPECLDRLVMINSPSKTFNTAGANCSYAVIPNPRLRHQFNLASRCAAGGVSPFAFAATEAAYRSGEAWRQTLIQELRSHYQLIAKRVQSWPGVRLTPLEATYLAWLEIKDLQLDNPELFFAKAGVGISPGSQFGDQDFIRLNFACPQAQLVKALDRMERAILRQMA